MTFASLDKRLGTKWRVPLAYATYAERVNGDVYVKHHTSVIAVLSPDEVYVTNAGYETSTTATRLRQILRDNHIPYTVRIQQFRMRLARNFTSTWDDFSSATFTKSENGWNLA
jgi:hypothetical protein